MKITLGWIVIYPTIWHSLFSHQVAHATMHRQRLSIKCHEALRWSNNMPSMLAINCWPLKVSCALCHISTFKWITFYHAICVKSFASNLLDSKANSSLPLHYLGRMPFCHPPSIDIFSTRSLIHPPSIRASYSW